MANIESNTDCSENKKISEELSTDDTLKTSTTSMSPSAAMSSLFQFLGKPELNNELTNTCNKFNDKFEKDPIMFAREINNGVAAATQLFENNPQVDTQTKDFLSNMFTKIGQNLSNPLNHGQNLMETIFKTANAVAEEIRLDGSINNLDLFKTFNLIPSVINSKEDIFEYETQNEVVPTQENSDILDTKNEEIIVEESCTDTSDVQINIQI